jgi:hypothetical protein
MVGTLLKSHRMRMSPEKQETLLKLSILSLAAILCKYLCHIPCMCCNYLSVVHTSLCCSVLPSFPSIPLMNRQAPLQILGHAKKGFGYPSRRPWFDLWSGHVGFVVDRAALVASFLRGLQFALPIIPSNTPHSGSSGAGTIGG